MKSIKVSESLHDDLTILKITMDKKSLDEVIRMMYMEFKRKW